MELQSALEGSLVGHFGMPVRVARLDRRPSRYSTSFSLEEIDVHLDDGTVLSLMFKDLGRTSLLDGAREVKPEFLHDPLREIDVYRRILSSEPLQTAECYGAVVDPAADRYWLFLERVAGAELSQVGELGTWQRVARWLADLHRRFAGRDELVSGGSRLLRYDGDFYRLWLRRARAFSGGDGERSPVRRIVEWLAPRYDAVVDRLVELSPTFMHGEFYASNVLVQDSAEGLRVCPVDWEMAAFGPGLIDLAALTAGAWTDEQSAAIAAAYRSGLRGDGEASPEGTSDPGEAGADSDFETALECCRLHIAVQWLGWAHRWAPPPEHVHDWAGEVVRRAERLEL